MIKVAVAVVMEVWDAQRRCCAVRQLELMGKALFNVVLEAVPQNLAWLDESKLPLHPFPS